MKYRRAAFADVGSIVMLENKAWPVQEAATKEQLEARIKKFPEGSIVAEEDGRIVGVVMGELLFYDALMTGSKNWNEITGGGYITTHQPTGDVLFGVDLSVDPAIRSKGVGQRLLTEIGKMAIKRNLKGGVLGARMPDYHQYSNKFSPEEYIKARREDGKLLDKELRFYKRNGLRLVKVLPDYFPDPESLNYGVLCFWKNPFYVKSRSVGRVVGRLGAALFKL